MVEDYLKDLPEDFVIYEDDDFKVISIPTDSTGLFHLLEVVRKRDQEFSTKMKRFYYKLIKDRSVSYQCLVTDNYDVIDSIFIRLGAVEIAPLFLNNTKARQYLFI
jgi:hypothetical protein